MKLLSTTSSGLVLHPKNKMVECIEIDTKHKEILRDILLSTVVLNSRDRHKKMVSHFFVPPQHTSQYTLPEKAD